MANRATNPPLSVVMAVHNNARYVPAAVRSILEQTFRDFELIVVDDGSHDRTPRLLSSFARQDSRIRVIHQPNAGLTAALCRGISESNGHFIARMDGDDISLPKRFELQMQFLRDHPEVVAVGGQILNIDASGSYIGGYERHCDHIAITRTLLAGDGAAICHPSVMFRRTHYDRVGGYDTRYLTAQDLDLFLKLGEVGRLANVANTVLLYRLHHASVTSTYHTTQLSNREAIVRAACERRGLRFDSHLLIQWPQHDTACRERNLAWLNLGWGNILAARIHAFKGVIRQPWKLGAWQTLAHCIRGF